MDDIQVMLDDHILKAQTMRGSPYVKAFETEMQNWEDKLISMQDILDAWLLVRLIDFSFDFCSNSLWPAIFTLDLWTIQVLNSGGAVQRRRELLSTEWSAEI